MIHRGLVHDLGWITRPLLNMGHASKHEAGWKMTARLSCSAPRKTYRLSALLVHAHSSKQVHPRQEQDDEDDDDAEYDAELLCSSQTVPSSAVGFLASDQCRY